LGEERLKAEGRRQKDKEKCFKPFHLSFFFKDRKKRRRHSPSLFGLRRKRKVTGCRHQVPGCRKNILFDKIFLLLCGIIIVLFKSLHYESF